MIDDQELSWEESVELHLPFSYQEEAKSACIKAIQEVLEEIEGCKTMHEVHQVLEVFKLKYT